MYQVNNLSCKHANWSKALQSLLLLSGTTRCRDEPIIHQNELGFLFVLCITALPIFPWEEVLCDWPEDVTLTVLCVSALSEL